MNRSSTSTITPREIDVVVKEFCLTVSPGNSPVSVDVIPQKAGAIQDECFFNVQNVIRKKGGRIIYGWIIWLWPRVLIEANHHAVWEKPDQALIDVTPRADGEKRILFLPDAHQIFDFENFQRLDNVRHPIADDDDVRGLISFSQQIHALCQQCSDGRLIRMDPGQRAQLMSLQRFAEACKRRILQKYG
jgi:hypothetical protein